MTPDFAREVHGMILQAVELERAYNEAVLPQPILGLSTAVLSQYIAYVTDRRLEELGFEPAFNVPNPAKWMAAETDVPEIVNFFEVTNTSYEVAAYR
jgi:ribonucleoside-diphosphate reductase beta chain